MFCVSHNMFSVSHSIFSVAHNMLKQRKPVPVHQLLGFSHGLIVFAWERLNFALWFVLLGNHLFGFA